MNIYKRILMLSLTMLLAFSLGCAATATREGTGEYIDDAAITAKVKAAILQEPNLKSTEINVETFKGIVQLSGFVSSSSDAVRATGVARKVSGVKDVHNDMRVKGQ